MTVSCSNCGCEWEQDPALEVPCPVCLADVGERCRRPSGHIVWGGQPHPERDRLAMQEVPGYGKCPARFGETQQVQMKLSDLPIFSAGE